MHRTESADIVIAVLNARYSHAALGPRYLLANMGGLGPTTALEEFLIGDHPERIAERILERRPRIVGFSLSIWNVEKTAAAIAILKRTAPKVRVIVGGPEVRWAEERPYDVDVLIRGEGETAFPDICRRLLDGEDVPPIVDGGSPDLASLVLPYGEYTDEDLKNRIIYVETSRGCPFGCEFCLSSREKTVRVFPREGIFEAFDRLIERGCRTFKFIDRTFNLDTGSCREILDFFYERWPRDANGNPIGPARSKQAALGSVRNESFFLHFEAVPDRFDEALLDSLARFPAGGIQLEVGVQTLDPAVGSRIGRRIDAEATARNIGLIKERTGVHVHADLIIGLPGEGENGVAASFDGLRSMGPDEIQVGILKNLPGTPIGRHAEEFGMAYNPAPPYDILATDLIPFARMQELKRFARYYGIFANSGKFAGTMARLMDSGPSAFAAFDAFSRWMWREAKRDHAIAQPKQYGLVLRYLVEEAGLEEEEAAALLLEDYLRIGTERFMPEILRPYHRPSAVRRSPRGT